MKKILSVLLVLLIAVTMLAGCGGSGGSGDSDGSGGGGSADVSPESLKTFGDILNLELEEYQVTQFPEDKALLYSFKLGDSYYRARADLDDALNSELWDLDFSDPEYDAKYADILGRIEIDELKDLTPEILSQSDLDALIGKTGQELLDDGWFVNGTYYLDEMGFWMDCGPFSYTVHFDGDPSTINTETFDPEEGIKEWKVTGAEFNMLGDHSTDI